MRKRLQLIGLSLLCYLFSFSTHAQTDKDVTLSVWVNEAIVATYTYNYNNFLIRQRQIAKYFTAEGWAAFSSALQSAGIPNEVKKNNYFVSAVATMPPKVKSLGANVWEAEMPLLVVYENPQFNQKQTLNVSIRFKKTTGSIGVRGLAIEALQTSVLVEPCKCLPPPPKPAEKKTQAAPPVKSGTQTTLPAPTVNKTGEVKP